MGSKKLKLKHIKCNKKSEFQCKILSDVSKKYYKIEIGLSKYWMCVFFFSFTNMLYLCVHVIVLMNVYVFFGFKLWIYKAELQTNNFKADN